MRRGGIILIGLAALLVIGIGGPLLFRAPVPDPDIDLSDWELVDIAWDDLFESQRATVLFRAPSDFKSQFRHANLLNAACREILTRSDHALAEIYRIDVNFTTAEKGRVFSGPLPVSVRDGTCAALRVDGMFVPTYPEPLQDWYLGGHHYQTGTKGEERTVIFAPMGGTDPSLEDFPLDRACRAVAADPVARRGVSILFLKIPEIRDGPLTIQARVNLGAAGVSITRSRSATFVLDGGRCDDV